ncbi:MAG: phosphatidate cytidylyltransferase [Acutalibacteraceae bacterium]
MKKRIISGVIGAAFIIIALALRETIVINIVVGIALVIAMLESQLTTKLITDTGTIVISCIYAFISAFFPVFGFMPTGLVVTALYILAVMLLTLAKPHQTTPYQVFYSLGITLLVSFGLTSILNINNLYITKDYMYTSSDCLFLLLFAFGGAWFADIGAYFIGSNFGKHKIAPNISPKKSLEGVIGGIISVVVCMLVLGLVWNFIILDKNSYIQFGWLILISALCPIVGFVGDLFFSYIKRNCQLKDFGKIMPGHGGILDRTDSLILVAPFIAMVLMYLPIIVHK